MNNEEKKQVLQDLLSTADEGLTNVLMEAAAEYQVASKENFVVPKEWIEEFEQRSADLRSGKDSGCNPRETILLAKKKLEELRNQQYNEV